LSPQHTCPSQPWPSFLQDGSFCTAIGLWTFPLGKAKFVTVTYGCFPLCQNLVNSSERLHDFSVIVPPEHSTVFGRIKILSTLCWIELNELNFRSMKELFLSSFEKVEIMASGVRMGQGQIWNVEVWGNISAQESWSTIVHMVCMKRVNRKRKR
jgi:hypothetical protein